MLKKRIEVARAVGDRVNRSEMAIDMAIQELGELTRYLPEARTEAGLAALHGQEALSEVSKAMGKLVSARARLVKAHDYLDETRSEIGLTVKMVGSWNGKDRLKPKASADTQEVPAPPALEEA